MGNTRHFIGHELNTRNRALGVGALGIAVLLTVSGCAVSAQETSGSQALTFATHGGEFAEIQYETMIEPFVEETGTAVNLDSPRDLSKIKVMVENDAVTWDAVFVDPDIAQAHCGTLFTPLDWDSIDQSTLTEGTYSECGLPINTYGVVMVYNVEKFKDNPPTSLADFYDLETFPGTRMIHNGPKNGMLEMALYADGVSKDELYPIDYDRAFSMLDRIKPSMITWEDGATSQEAIVSQSADMALLWSGRALDSAKAGAPYQPMWDGNYYAWSSVAIVKGAPNLEAANNLVQHLSTPEPQVRFSEALAYGPANNQAKPEWDELRQEWEPSLEGHISQAIIPDTEWWSENEEEAIDRWLEWIQQ